MKKHWIGWILVLVVGIMGTALAAPSGVDSFLQFVENTLADHEARIAALEGATTTTTVPPSTTTTVPATTTTTAPTTTTTQPTTTTTTVPSSTSTTQPTTNLVIPATQPYVSGSTLRDAEGFNIMIGCLDTDDLDCGRNGKPNGIEGFTYSGHLMPYVYGELPPGLHDHAWWVPGDRERYVCAYAFMYDRHPNPFGGDIFHPDGHFIARATIARPLGQGYGQVNDRYMKEAVRLYDGTLAVEADRGGSTGNELNEDCRNEALDNFDYEGFVPQGPDEIRVGLFKADGKIADIRDFTVKNPSLGSHFELLKFDGQRVTIAAILGLNNKVSQIFYYDVMNDGQIAVELNGQLVDPGYSIID